MQPRAPSALMNWRSWVWRPAKKTVSARLSQIRWVIWRKVLAVVPSSLGSAGEVNSSGACGLFFRVAAKAALRVSV